MLKKSTIEKAMDIENQILSVARELSNDQCNHCCRDLFKLVFQAQQIHMTIPEVKEQVDRRFNVMLDTLVQRGVEQREFATAIYIVEDMQALLEKHIADGSSQTW